MNVTKVFESSFFGCDFSPFPHHHFFFFFSKISLNLSSKMVRWIRMKFFLYVSRGCDEGVHPRPSLAVDPSPPPPSILTVTTAL